jgi:hypothetical protein
MKRLEPPERGCGDEFRKVFDQRALARAVGSQHLEEKADRI